MARWSGLKSCAGDFFGILPHSTSLRVRMTAGICKSKDKDKGRANAKCKCKCECKIQGFFAPLRMTIVGVASKGMVWMTIFRCLRRRRFARGANNPPFAMGPRRMGHPAAAIKAKADPRRDDNRKATATAKTTATQILRLRRRMTTKRQRQRQRQRRRQRQRQRLRLQLQLQIPTG
jgi:hypothetical protein